MNNESRWRLAAFVTESLVRLLAALWILSAAIACAAPAAPTPVVVHQDTPAPHPQPTGTATRPASAAATLAEGALASGTLAAGALTLTWWTPEFLSPDAPQPAGPVLAGQLAAFSESLGGRVRVATVRKARYGKGGLLDALRTAQPVASGTLPDIVALDVVEVEKAVGAGLLQPLDSLLDTAVTESLYAFASETGLLGERLYAVQYLADLDHAAYLPAQVREPPLTWADVVGLRTAYLFPLAPGTRGAQGSAAGRGETLSNAVLGQYLSAGATLAPDRRLVLESQPLLHLLTFYEDAGKAGVLPPASQELADGEAIWSIFEQGNAPLALVSARRFLAQENTQGGFAPAPGMSGAATPISSGWVLAIVTTDSERQQAAAQLIAWLLKPENAVQSASAVGWLPTSPEALKALGGSPYLTFLDGQLAQARSVPAGLDYSAVALRMDAAIVSVVRGESSAAAAAEGAINGRQ